MSMEGRVALVTGGSRGIGRAICVELARNGARVAVNYAGSSQAAQETVELCRALGVEAESFQADVSDPAACEALVSAVKERFGQIDILVNNAGVARDGLLMTAKEADFDQTMDTNLKGTYFCMKAVSRLMLRQKYGRIVSLSSVVGLRGNPGQTAYAASKAGVLGLVKAAAKELAGRDITVNAVAPGFIETDMTAALPEKARQAMLTTIPKGRPGSSVGGGRGGGFLGGYGCGLLTRHVAWLSGGLAV